MTDPERIPSGERRKWSAPALQALFRPALTAVLACGLFLASITLVHTGKLASDLWFSSWMQIVGMMVAFFFGERSALKTHDEEAKS